MTTREPEFGSPDSPDPRDQSFERWLLEAARGARALSGPSAPEGLTDRIMARVALEGRATAVSPSAVHVAAGALHDTLPWWVRAVASRASVLALAVLALVTAFPNELLQAPATVEAWSAAALGIVGAAFLPFFRILAAPVSGSFDAPGMGLALSVALSLPAFLVSIVLYRWSAGLASAFTKSPR
ncbi:MAG: hypothetical protein ACREOU_03930 [Candidatus Eiseniibacteriota bacterium]